MNRVQRATLILVLVLPALVYWRFRAPQNQPQSRKNEPVSALAPGHPSTQEKANTAETTSAVQPSSPDIPSPARAATNPTVTATPELAPLPQELAGLTPMTVLENLRTSIRQYGALFGGNPVGTNPEITKALQGENPKHLNFLKADGNRVNGNGELVDVWGTPYFFHQLSGTEMEIRSAGPDKRMWTQDDLVIK